MGSERTVKRIVSDLRSQADISDRSGQWADLMNLAREVDALAPQLAEVEQLRALLRQVRDRLDEKSAPVFARVLSARDLIDESGLLGESSDG